MKRSTSTQLFGLLAVCAGLGACLSPTLPLPPPEEPDAISASDEEGVWEVRGSNTPGAVVLVKNLNTGVIAGSEDKDGDGRYFIRIAGSLCDGAEVSEIIGDDTSDSTFFLLEDVVNGEPAGDCPR
jgi:hypothetical protein